MKSILESGNLKGKRVLVRVDWNVPIENGKVVDDFRIKKSLPTLEYLENAGAKVNVATHLESKDASIDSLKTYVPKGMKLLANLRDNPGEKSNSEKFARELASKVDIYVNEAFSASHREHDPSAQLNFPDAARGANDLWFGRQRPPPLPSGQRSRAV